MVLVIGNPTNIYLAQNAGIAFFPHLKVMLFPTVLSGIVSLAVLLLIFRRSLSIPMSPIPAEVTFRRRAPLVIGLIHLSACTVLLAVSSYVGLEMWWISLGFSVSLALFGSLIALLDRRRPIELWRTLLRLPYQLIPFVLAMFALVLALRAYGVSERIFEFLSPLPTVPTYGMLSFLASNLLNNIPMSVLFSSVVAPVGDASIPALYAAVIGSNVGAFFTPMGALAGIMWLTLLRQHNVKLSFGKFMAYGAMISIPTLLAALLGLSILL
jgi:arsenical pump membrane protein